MTLEDTQMMAFQMIAYAGDALDHYYQALTAYFLKNKELSQQKIVTGNECLNQCHVVQTKLIQAESNGEQIPYSLIMTHAQDHFTMATNWQKLAQLMINEVGSGEAN